MQVCSKKLVQKMGVYAVKIYISQKEYFGMCNIACANSKIEVHIFDFQKIFMQELLKLNLLKD